MPILVPLPEDFAIRRADLTLGLRAATLYYQELAVPGIGGAWCVRHFSWPVAGISLACDPGCEKISAATIANALEALANKVEWTKALEKDHSTLEVLGKRAFAREPHEWRFERLKSREYYVMATYRQTVTRALPTEAGLGFASGAGRFNSMQLSVAGRELAKAFLTSEEQRGRMGQGTPYLGKNLLKWIAGEFCPGDYLADLRKRLSYRYPTKVERELVRGRLLSLVPYTDVVVGRHDSERRNRLAQCLEKLVRRAGEWDDVPRLQEELRKNGGDHHADEIETALQFEEMRSAAVDLLARLAVLVNQSGSGIKVKDATQDGRVGKLFGKLQQRARTYLNRPDSTHHPVAIDFGKRCQKDVADVIEFIVRRDNRILQVANGEIWKGPVFRADFAGIKGAGEEDLESRTTGRPHRIFQFINLWNDCNG